MTGTVEPPLNCHVWAFFLNAEIVVYRPSNWRHCPPYRSLGANYQDRPIGTGLLMLSCLVLYLVWQVRLLPKYNFPVKLGCDSYCTEYESDINNLFILIYHLLFIVKWSILEGKKCTDRIKVDLLSYWMLYYWAIYSFMQCKHKDIRNYTNSNFNNMC